MVHAMYLMELRYQWLIVLAVVVIVGTELRLWRRDAGGNTYGNFWWSLGLIVVAEVFSLLDATRIWCEPDNLLLHGHAIWHLVAAVSVGFAFVHYRQFDGELGPDGV